MANDTIRRKRRMSGLPGCPLDREGQDVIRQGQELVRRLRRLKRQLAVCQACELVDTCPVIQAFNAQVQAVILELTEAWGWRTEAGGGM